MISFSELSSREAVISSKIEINQDFLKTAGNGNTLSLPSERSAPFSPTSIWYLDGCCITKS